MQRENKTILLRAIEYIYQLFGYLHLFLTMVHHSKSLIVVAIATYTNNSALFLFSPDCFI